MSGGKKRRQDELAGGMSAHKRHPMTLRSRGKKARLHKNSFPLEKTLLALPADLSEKILGKISFAGIQRLRLSGFGTGNKLSKSLDIIEKERLNDILLLKDAVYPSNFIESPAQLCKLLSKYFEEPGRMNQKSLHLHSPSPRVMKSLEREVPLCRSIHIWNINIQALQDAGLSDAFQDCKHLRNLIIQCRGDLGMLPESVLRLTYLKTFKIYPGLSCKGTLSLPLNMGWRMPNLEYVEFECNVGRIPQSLLQTIERNFDSNGLVHGLILVDMSGVNLEPNASHDELHVFLKKNAHLFPKLNQNIVRCGVRRVHPDALGAYGSRNRTSSHYRSADSSISSDF